MVEALRPAHSLRKPRPRPAEARPPVFEARAMAVFAGRQPILRDVDLRVPARGVVALVGPSGVGKSTLLKALNRLVDLESPPLRVEGRVSFQGRDVYRGGWHPDDLRARIGMLFQQPIVFPCSVGRNVLFGARRLERLSRGVAERRLEKALREASLWEEVRDRLDAPATTLSVGQQQRLCLARALAVRPEAILMDEPTSALDRKAGRAIEELIRRLSRRHGIVLVTHDVGQARRTADELVCLARRDGAGTRVECAECRDLFPAGDEGLPDGLVEGSVR